MYVQQRSQITVIALKLLCQSQSQLLKEIKLSGWCRVSRGEHHKSAARGRFIGFFFLTVSTLMEKKLFGHAVYMIAAIQLYFSHNYIPKIANFTLQMVTEMHFKSKT